MLKYDHRLLICISVVFILFFISLMMDNRSELQQQHITKKLIATQYQFSKSLDNRRYKSLESQHQFHQLIDQNLSSICQNIELKTQYSSNSTHQNTQIDQQAILWIIDPIDLDFSIFFQPKFKKIVLILDQNLNLKSRQLLESFNFKIDQNKQTHPRAMFQPATLHQSSISDQNLIEKWQKKTLEPIERLPILINTFDPLWFTLQEAMIPYWSFDAQHPWVFRSILPKIDLLVISDADLFKDGFYEAIDSLDNGHLMMQYDLLFKRSLNLRENEKFKTCLLQINKRLVSAQLPSVSYSIIASYFLEMIPPLETFLIWKSNLEPVFKWISQQSLFSEMTSQNLILFLLLIFILSLIFKFWMGNQHHV
jgi:hypothetical protein